MKVEENLARAVDFYGNDVNGSYDNAIELDQSAGNSRCFRNRYVNTFMPLSFQPIFGGPAYAIRNLVINAAVEQTKLHNATVGVLVFNNSFVGAAYAFQVLDGTTPREIVIENNIWMGPSPAPGGRTVNWDQPLDPPTYTVDSNGWYPDGQFHFGYGATGNDYANFAAVQAGGLYEAHGRLLGASIFASGLMAPPSYKTAVTPTDGTLASGSEAIDHGMMLPNITDGYQGAAPDLGAQEMGCPVPIYGVRPEGIDESNEPIGCGGPANLADGGTIGGDAAFAGDGSGDGGANGEGGGFGSSDDGGAGSTMGDARATDANGDAGESDAGLGGRSKSGCGCTTVDAGRPSLGALLGAVASLALIARRRVRGRGRRGGWRRFVAIAVLSLMPSCFAGYDSRWGEAKRAQQRVAADTKPASITASLGDEGKPDGGTRSLVLRVRPSGRYLAQTVDAPKRVADLIDDSNRVLGSTLGVHLELDRIQPWSSDADERLQEALDALCKDDDGRDADVVVGMIGALPRQTDSLHELGMANLLGKHMVLRASGRVGERDAIDKGFYELSQDERSRLVRVRERHRALAVFLHELGHTLGALHEADRRSLMHASYDKEMAGFGGGAVALIRIALAENDRAAVARGQLTVLRGSTSSDWIGAERDEEIARLESMLLATKTGLDAAFARSTPEVPSQIGGQDADRYVRATMAFRNGAVATSYEMAKPLFAEYPNVLAVQDLRCQLATVRWLDADALKAECAPYVRLSKALDAGADR